MSEATNNEVTTNDVEFDESTGEIVEHTTESAQSFIFNSIDTNTPENKIRFLNSMNNSISLKDIGDKPLIIVDAFTVNGVRNYRNTPKTPCINSYLLDSAGRTFFSQSAGIARSLYAIHLMFPDFNKPKGLKIRVNKTSLDDDKTLKSLEVIL